MDFIKNIPENAALFRGISDRNNIISNWFCLNLPDTGQYGSRKFVFKTNEKILSNKQDSITPIWVQKMHESLANFKQPIIDKNIIMTGWNKHNITEEQKAEMEKISELTRKLIANAVTNPPYITVDKYMKKSLFGGKTRKRKNK